MIQINTLLQPFTIIASDLTRPWGGFYVIDETQAQLFADTFFDGLDVQTLTIGGKLSPKILLVAPEKRLSWQYHNRRAEIWKVVSGQVGVVRSQTLAQGERHRLVGLATQAVIAEIWQHTDANHPSNEDDIVRVQDDFGR
jgi:mannose-6-phosphate isomerase-like protein (cupin superfamily)